MKSKIYNEDDKIKLKIFTPRGIKFEKKADFIRFRAIDGEMGIQPKHKNITHLLGNGLLRIYNNGIEEKIALFEGIIEVNPNSEINIYTTLAQDPAEIDLERAKQDRLEAEAALESSDDDVDMKDAMLAIRRALVRIEVAIHSDEDGYFDNNND